MRAYAFVSIDTLLATTLEADPTDGKKLTFVMKVSSSIHRMALLSRRRWFSIALALLYSTYIISYGVSAFSPRHPSNNNVRYITPIHIQSTSPRSISRGTKLYNFLDAVGDILSGPKLEAETNLPYDPPFSDELSISDNVRTFAIKERP